MRIEFDTSALRRTRGHEYRIRFLVGGSVTVIAALVAKRFGAEIGGLFLAFPAIFPSTATLIASHEEHKKAEADEHGSLCARKLAGADAAGAAMGGAGLAAFAAVTYWTIVNHSTIMALALATLAWLLVSVLIWEGRELIFRRLRKKLRKLKTQHGEHRSSPARDRSSHE
jgi:Protein of unknown function (DUF3147)